MSNEALLEAGLNAAGTDPQTSATVARETEKARKQGGVSDEQAAAIGGAAGAAAGASLQAIGIPAPIGMAIGAAVGKELGPIIKDGVNYLFGGETAADMKRREYQAAKASIDRTNKLLEYQSAVFGQVYNHREAMVAFLLKQKIGTAPLVASEKQARDIVNAVEAKLPFMMPTKMLWWYDGGKFSLNVFKSDPLVIQRLDMLSATNKKLMRQQWAVVADVVTMLRAQKLAQFMMAMKSWADAMAKKTAETKAAADRQRLAEEAARKLAEETAARDRRARTLKLALLAGGVGAAAWMFKKRRRAA